MNLIDNTHVDFLRYKEVLLAQNSSLSPLYQSSVLKYFESYFKQDYIDVSFCIELGKKPLLLVLVTKPVEKKISYYDLPIQLIWHEDVSCLERKGVTKKVLKQLNILQENTNASMHYSELSSEYLSDFAVSLLKAGATTGYSFIQKINLVKTQEQLFSDVRKIYRANIRWGQTQLTYKLINSETIREYDIENFRKLHVQIAGRETRSQASWQAQGHMIKNKAAFAVFGYLDKTLVAAGLFIYNHSECYYSVGAYQRELFDKPLSHASVWQAILEAKKLGCRIFTLGDAYFPGSDSEMSNKKEQSISHFKQGFGGDFCQVLSLIS